MNILYFELNVLPKIKSIIISDRNASRNDARKFVDRDIRRMLTNPNLCILVAFRNTTYTLDAMGVTSFGIEGGHGQSMLSLPDKIGTGWMNIMAAKHYEILKELGDPNAPVRSFMEYGNSYEQQYGILGFANNAIGISEDYWAVVQQFYNMISLGYTPEVGLTESLGNKMRESKDYAEWKAAPPRWSSGLIQSMESMLNQQVNEFGPESYAEKEARQTNADHYLLGPLVLFDLLMMPISIWFDWSPFVGISLLFWIPGIVLNQISTLNSLLAYVRHMGFWAGLGRWLSLRISDALLFSSRTVRDALAQIAGYFGVSFEFKMSGGGGANPMHVIFPFWYKTVEMEVDGKKKKETKFTLWGGDTKFLDVFTEWFSFFNTFLFGFILLITNGVALLFLDATNAVMMILSLWFAVGVCFGPFLKSAKKGEMVWEGMGDLLAKVIGHVLGVAFLLSGMIGIHFIHHTDKIRRDLIKKLIGVAISLL